MKRILAAAAFCCAHCVVAQADTPLIKFSYTDNSVSEAEAKRAVEIFINNCSPLNRFLGDFSEIDVQVRKEIAEYRLEMGWKTEIHIRMTVPDDPKFVPRYDPRTHVISGHTLHYYVGGGKKPGIIGAKRSSQMLCGLPIDQGGSVTFKSVSELSSLQY